MRALVIIFFLGSVAACGPTGPAPGTEGGPCYGNKTCNEPLSCVGGYCVGAAKKEESRIRKQQTPTRTAASPGMRPKQPPTDSATPEKAPVTKKTVTPKMAPAATAPRTAPVSAHPECTGYAEALCKVPGLEAALCSEIKTVMTLLPGAVCVKGMSDIAYSRRIIQKPCDVVVSRLCEALGPKHRTCKMIRRKTKKFKSSRCRAMLNKYPEVLAKVRQIAGQKPAASDPPVPPKKTATTPKTSTARAIAALPATAPGNCKRVLACLLDLAESSNTFLIQYEGLRLGKLKSGRAYKITKVVSQLTRSLSKKRPPKKLAEACLKMRRELHGYWAADPEHGAPRTNLASFIRQELGSGAHKTSCSFIEKGETICNIACHAPKDGPCHKVVSCCEAAGDLYPEMKSLCDRTLQSLSTTASHSGLIGAERTKKVATACTKEIAPIGAALAKISGPHPPECTFAVQAMIKPK